MNRQIRFSIWFPIVLVAAFAAGYLFWQQTLFPGPYDLEPMTVIRNHGAITDTTNWKTYRNEKYGFEFRYPEDWITENPNAEIDRAVFFHQDWASLPFGDLPNEGGIEFTTLENTNLMDINSWIAQNIGLVGLGGSAIKERTGDIEYYKIIVVDESLGEKVGDFVLPKEDLVFVFYTIGSNNIEIVYQVLSTFKFIR